MTQRIHDRLYGDTALDNEILVRAIRTGEYIDQHTTILDKRTSHEVLNIEPKCCVKYIPLTQGFFAIVDYRNYDKLMKYKWFVLKRKNTNYAARHINNEKGQLTIMMHNKISQPPKGMETDHRNHNGLDNREYNLRHCSKAQNQYNQKPRGGYSKYKGVTWSKRTKNHWQAQINKGEKHFSIGYFATELEAAIAYDKKAKELFGDFANFNL